jgi:quercetin dioxygenase-like cupin family protein
VKIPAYLMLSILVLLGIATEPTLAQTTAPQQTSSETSRHPLFVKFPDVEWKRACSELGERSGEISILHVDPTTQATQLLVRLPKNWEVTKHWHTANETHTVLSGTFIMECEGRRAELGPGGFNYTPSKMVHQAWTTPEEGAVVFITVDRAWDVNFVGRSQAPTASGRNSAHRGPWPCG